MVFWPKNSAAFVPPLVRLIEEHMVQQLAEAGPGNDELVSMKLLLEQECISDTRRGAGTRR